MGIFIPRFLSLGACCRRFFAMMILLAEHNVPYGNRRRLDSEGTGEPANGQVLGGPGDLRATRWDS